MGGHSQGGLSTLVGCIVCMVYVPGNGGLLRRCVIYGTIIVYMMRIHS